MGTEGGQTGEVGELLETLTLFYTEIYDFLYPISDWTQSLNF